jgi:hypothetical protein
MDCIFFEGSQTPTVKPLQSIVLINSPFMINIERFGLMCSLMTSVKEKVHKTTTSSLMTPVKEKVLQNHYKKPFSD